MAAAIAFSSSLLACAHAGPQPGDHLSLQGRLVLKGSDPLFTPVLIVAGEQGGQWELRGMERSEALRLQSTMLRVSGTVLQVGAALPAVLRVEEVRIEERGK
ncbi:hypothetical protein [Pigmentiphaga soli]